MLCPQATDEIPHYLLSMNRQQITLCALKQQTTNYMICLKEQTINHMMCPQGTDNNSHYVFSKNRQQTTWCTIKEHTINHTLCRRRTDITLHVSTKNNKHQTLCPQRTDNKSQALFTDEHNKSPGTSTTNTQTNTRCENKWRIVNPHYSQNAYVQQFAVITQAISYTHSPQSKHDQLPGLTTRHTNSITGILATHVK